MDTRRSFLRIMALGAVATIVPTGFLDVSPFNKEVILPGVPGNYPKLRMADIANSIIRQMGKRIDPDGGRFRTPVVDGNLGRFDHLLNVDMSIPEGERMAYDEFESRFIMPVSLSLVKAVNDHNFKSFGSMRIPTYSDDAAVVTDPFRNLSVRVASFYEPAIRRQVVTASILGT